MSNTIAVLIFGAFIIVAEASVMIVRNRGWGIHSVRIVGLTLISVAAVFLAVSSSERVGAAYALLGVLAGFLVGQIETRPKKADQSDED
jgi:hypothetical protein